MKQYAPLYTIFLMFIFFTSCKDSNQSSNPIQISKAEKDTVSLYGPTGMVRNIREDKKGNILIAAFKGVFRYDGKTFTNLTSKIKSPTFWDVLEDRKGNLWLATRNSGVYCYNGKSFQHFTTREGLVDNRVVSVYEDKAGNIWFGGSIIKDEKDKVLVVEAGLWRYDGITYTKVSQRGASVIIEDKKGNVWTTGAVKPNGYWALSRYNQETLYDKKPVVTEIMSIKGAGILCGILEANDGSIWFGSLNGVYRYDGKTVTDFKSKVGQK